ncbi:MAG: 2-keto-4-pentenoate hydratase [Tahibacter sp.]
MNATSAHFAPAAAAAALVRARREGRSLADFPGPLPSDLAHAYRCQDAAIELWPERVIGWKVGYIAPERRDGSGDERLLGPVFERALWKVSDGLEVEFPVFVGGFAAVEAEYVFCLGDDAPADRMDWTNDAAADLVATMHIAIETAGSPLATINLLGPSVVVSDFGNNAGLILGQPIHDWQRRGDHELNCSTWIDDVCVGHGGASRLERGPLGALAFALGRSAQRGRALRKGDLVTTGAATGIHDIVAGQQARAVFDGIGEIRCRAIARPVQESTC